MPLLIKVTAFVEKNKHTNVKALVRALIDKTRTFRYGEEC